MRSSSRSSSRSTLAEHGFGGAQCKNKGGEHEKHVANVVVAVEKGVGEGALGPHSSRPWYSILGGEADELAQQ